MITKVSEITAQDVAEYVRVDEPNLDEFNLYLNVAKDYISNYTGIAKSGEGETLDDYQDLIIVVYILCQDMYDNRTMYVDKAQPNKVVETILNMHQRNLI